MKKDLKKNRINIAVKDEKEKQALVKEILRGSRDFSYKMSLLGKSKEELETILSRLPPLEDPTLDKEPEETEKTKKGK